MASRRMLKKAIRNVTDEILADCMAVSLTGDADETRLAELAAKALRLEKEYVARVNHTEPGSERLFYKKLREKLEAEANSIASDVMVL